MTRRYYTSRTKPEGLVVEELYWKLENLYLFFRDKDYFREKAGITESGIPNVIKYKAAMALKFQPFPVTKWSHENITEDHVFDTLEFLYDHVSKPGKLVTGSTELGWNYREYVDYDAEAGQKEFRGSTNAFLVDYKTGFELTKEGHILALGTHGLQHILDAEIVPYDKRNVDSKVRNAIA